MSRRIKEIYKELYQSYSYDHSYMERVLRCKDTVNIPKVQNAGEIITQKDSRCQVMHNGVLIHEGCYHQQWVTDIIKVLKGHHEPQEEKLFYEALACIGKGGSMLECGSFWAYYSLWFNKEVPEAKNIMIEPVPLKMEVGQLNFTLNDFEGEFLNGYIGSSPQPSSVFHDWDGTQYNIPEFSVDGIMDTYDIKSLDMLHADIQNNEISLLTGAADALSSQKIKFIFLGTHMPNFSIAKKLESYGYHILEQFEVAESFFDDGLIVACSPSTLKNIDANKFKVSKNES